MKLPVLLFAALVVVLGLLAWSMKQSADFKVEVIAAEARIGKLTGDVDALQEQLAKLKLELLMTASLPDRAGITDVLAPESTIPSTPAVKQLDVDTEGDVSSVHPSDEVEDIALEDTTDPQQESVGVTDGKLALKELDYKSAIDNFVKVDTSAADYIEARMGVANAYFYSRQYEKALVEFQHVLAREPGFVEAAIGLANAYHRLGQRAEEILAYSRAISIEPGQWLHYNSRATAYMLEGEDEQAIQDFQQAARLAGPLKADQATALENIGLIYLRAQQWQLAFQHSNEVKRLDSRQTWNWLIRAIAAARLQRNVDAYVAFDEWFKYKRATDPYLLKQLLPESLHAFIDAAPGSLAKLVDPPLSSGELCVNDYQCLSRTCRPGPPFNKLSYCVARDKDCSAPDSSGYLSGESLRAGGTRVRCYPAGPGRFRWTEDDHSAG